MFKTKPSFWLILALVPCLVTTPVQAKAKHRRHHSAHHLVKKHHGAPVAKDAGYADLVILADSGRVIHATNPERLRHPASLTKMMTLYLTFEALEAGRLKLDQHLPVSKNASQQSPSKLGLRAGSSIKVEDAILGLVTESANDAAVVLAEAMGGSEEHFGELMTRQAHALGMAHTNFDNPSGLPDPDQVTCAADMARLGHALIYHYPRYYAYFSTPSFTYGGINHHNHNHLMERYDGMDGIKTGYIRASGFNLVASAVQGQTRLIGVIFGGHSAVARDNQMAQLLDQSFATVPRLPKQPASLSGGEEAQGDDADNTGGSLRVGDYITLPGKVAAIFPPAQAVPAVPPVKPVAANTPTTNAPAVVSNINQKSQTVAAPVAPTIPPVAAAAPSSGVALQPVIQPPAAPLPVATPLAAPPPLVNPLESEVPQAGYAGTGWSIQIGAYNDAAIARQSLANISQSNAQLLGNAEPLLQQVEVNNAALYRARLTKLDEKTARVACANLVKHGQNCLVIAPE